MHSEPSSHKDGFNWRRFIQGAGLGIVVSIPIAADTDEMWLRLLFPALMAAMMGTGFAYRPLQRANTKMLTILLAVSVVTFLIALLVWFVVR